VTPDPDHYRGVVRDPRRTRLARCGYLDRFDPVRLNASPRVRALYDGLFRLISDGGAPPRLLDIGAGTGVYLDTLARHAGSVVAVDASADMIRVARDYCAGRGLAGVACAVADAAALPFPDGAFDAVVALDVLHHVDRPAAVLAEAHRVLRPGGRLLVFEPNVLNPAMLLVHALPREERRALGLCRPRRLRTLAEARFDTRHWSGVCQLVTDASGLRRRLLDAYLRAFGLLAPEWLHPRQVWVGVKKG